MANPLNPVPKANDIVLNEHISFAKNRIDVRKLPEEKIKELMRTANVFEQKVFLQDLLIRSKGMKAVEHRKMVALAAELYMQTSQNTQEGFLNYLLNENSLNINPLLIKFTNAMLTNSMFHACMESVEKGSSGLTNHQLDEEKTLAASLKKHILQ